MSKKDKQEAAAQSQTPDKTLGDAFREALERAAFARSTEGATTDKERCNCMGCSGNPIVVKHYMASTLTMTTREGTSRDGEAEMEFILNLPEIDVTHVAVRGTTEVGEFKDAIRELFA